LNADDNVTFAQDVQLDGFRDPPLDTLVDVILPDGLAKVRLLLGDEEGVDASVEMGVLRRLAVCTAGEM
jgi:hypothetical protein